MNSAKPCIRHLIFYSALIFVDGAQAQILTVSPADLRAHVEFLSSDELEGRATPSKGLDVAGEYIAVQFRRAGLQPPPGGSWFQAGDRPGTRNVIGVLHGSDPKLRDQYLLVTAHYDHIGIRKPKEGETIPEGTDLIRNGANDNASGVASMIATARLLSSMRVHPKRTVVFIAFYGEELGLVGSRFYAAHPVFPIASTIGQINFEQTGRTDDAEAPNKATLNVTGFGYSELPSILAGASAPYGIKVLERPKWTDEAFERSDNEALAKAGVPAHTLSTAYVFPDYHRPGDEWDKLDYDNMARITAAGAAGIAALANRTAPPRWYTGAPVGESSATELSKAITRPAAPPAVSAPKSGKSPATRRRQPRPRSAAR